MLMGGLEFVEFGYLTRLYAINMPQVGVLGELIFISLLSSLFPVWVAYRLRKGYGIAACSILLLLITLEVLGELEQAIPIVLGIVKFAVPAVLMPQYVAELLHAMCYAIAVVCLVRLIKSRQPKPPM